MKNIMMVIMLVALSNFVAGSIVGPENELRFTNIKGFCVVADNSNLHSGVAAMLGLTGVGKVYPNILMMGYKNDWAT